MKDLFKEASLVHSAPYQTPDKKTWHRKARRILRRLLFLEGEEEGKRGCPNCMEVKNAIEFTFDPRFGWCNTCHMTWIDNRYT